MFAGFNFRIDSQENLINFSDYAIQGKNHLDIPMHLYLPTGLSEQDKELILLRIDKKLSFDEIAEYYGITNDACRQRLSRAIRKCRSLLDCEK